MRRSPHFPRLPKWSRLRLALFLAGVILVLGAAAAIAATSFSDVPTTYTHYAGISWASKEGVALGYADGTYRPENPVTRGQMATFLQREAQALVAAGAFVEWTFGASPPVLKQWFNHQTGAAPVFTRLGMGRHELDFGFNLVDPNNPHFVQVTPARVVGTDPAVVGPVFLNTELSGNKVRVWTWNLLSPDPQKLVDSSFYVLVY